MPVANIRPGTIRSPPPIPKKPDNVPAPKPMPRSHGRLARLRRTSRSPAPARLRSINAATTSISIEKAISSFCSLIHLPTVEPRQRAGNARRREDECALPFHVSGTGVMQQVGKGAGGDGNGARADRDMRVGNADDINEKRDGEDRSAAAHEPQREPDERAGGDAEPVLRKRVDHHGLSIGGSGSARR